MARSLDLCRFPLVAAYRARPPDGNYNAEEREERVKNMLIIIPKLLTVVIAPLGDKFARLWEEEVAQAKGKRTPSLLRVIIKAYAAKCMLYGFFCFLMECGIR